MGAAVRGFPKVQLIDLDAAKGAGRQRRARARRSAARCLPRRRRHPIVERARGSPRAGAPQVIVGSALFGRAVDLAVRRGAAPTRVGAERLIAAVDSSGGRVVIHGWRTALPLTPADAVRALEPFFGEFLYTHVDAKG